MNEITKILQNEQFGFILLAIGLSLALIGVLWLIVRAFQTSFGWGLGIFVPIIGPIAYAFKHTQKAKLPIFLILLGGIIALMPLVLNQLLGEKVAEKPLQREVDGVKQVNALNAKDPKYQELAKSDADSFNLSRADFTDEIAEIVLSGKTNLKRLEIADSTITDKSLELIAKLPNLEVLVLPRVKGITEAVAKQTILKMEKLKEIDARGTAISVETLREWRKENSERKSNPK